VSLLIPASDEASSLQAGRLLLVMLRLRRNLSLFSFALAAVTNESLHKLADLIEAAEFKGSRDLARDPPVSQAAPEPFLWNWLHSRAQFWRSIGASSFVMGIITVGYMLPWIAGPPSTPAFFQNHSSAVEHSEFVDKAVSSLMITGAIQQVLSRPFFVNPLGVVPKGEDKLHLIQDLRFLNQFLQARPFKYELIRSVSKLCSPGDLLFYSGP
jgi:hypothetical protein